MSKDLQSTPDAFTEEHEWHEIVKKQVSQLRYGSVQITVHDGRVTQVESIEKTRFVQRTKESGK